MNPNDLMALKDILAPNDDADDYDQFKGSVLNPGAIGGEKKKKVAKPNAKIEKTLDKRKQIKGEQKKKEVKEGDAIWK